MFCIGLEDAEYCLFNKQIDKNLFDLLEKQYLRYMTELLDFVRDWPVDSVGKLNTKATEKFDDWYHPIPDRFWKWARTIPNFDPMILYNITMIPEILLE
jgi:hypothetical protein